MAKQFQMSHTSANDTPKNFMNIMILIRSKQFFYISEKININIDHKVDV